MPRVYTEMPYKTYREGQRNQIICLLGLALYVIILLSVLCSISSPISWIFNNIWFLVVPAIPSVIFVGLAIRWANKKY